MQLPGRLRLTTLGDLLGTLYRAGSSGTLELTEDRGRAHRIHVARGHALAVELDGTSASLAEILRESGATDEDVLRRSLLRALASSRLHGEVLVHEFHVSPAVVGNALRRQVMMRLGVLDQLSDARVSFRVAIRHPRGALGPSRGGTGAGASSDSDWNASLDLRAFLPGRRRARARVPGSSRREVPTSRVHAETWQLLGLTPGADVSEIKRAYRRLARAVHPDLHPDVSDEERRALEKRFTQLTDAYRILVA